MPRFFSPKEVQKQWHNSLKEYGTVQKQAFLCKCGESFKLKYGTVFEHLRHCPSHPYSFNLEAASAIGHISSVFHCKGCDSSVLLDDQLIFQHVIHCTRLHSLYKLYYLLLTQPSFKIELDDYQMTHITLWKSCIPQSCHCHVQFDTLNNVLKHAMSCKDWKPCLVEFIQRLILSNDITPKFISPRPTQLTINGLLSNSGLL